MPRVIHFEIVADKPDRAMKFYKEVFGWEFPLVLSKTTEMLSR
jgi:predicted enzyme related to lactoylglutathione lyase